MRKRPRKQAKNHYMSWVHFFESLKITEIHWISLEFTLKLGYVKITGKHWETLENTGFCLCLNSLDSRGYSIGDVNLMRKCAWKQHQMFRGTSRQSLGITGKHWKTLDFSRAENQSIFAGRALGHHFWCTKVYASINASTEGTSPRSLRFTEFHWKTLEFTDFLIIAQRYLGHAYNWSCKQAEHYYMSWGLFIESLGFTEKHWKTLKNTGFLRVR
jgi:hypothetical protein